MGKASNTLEYLDIQVTITIFKLTKSMPIILCIEWNALGVLILFSTLKNKKYDDNDHKNHYNFKRA